MIPKYDEEDFINNLTNPIYSIMQQAQYQVLSVITNRVRNIGKLSATDAHRLSQLIRMEDLDTIESIIAAGTNLSVKEIDSIIERAATNNDNLAEKYYKARNMPPSNFKTDLSLLTIVEQAKKSMVDDVVRLSNTTAFVINGKVTDIGKTYNYAVNRAVFEVQQGLFDFNTAIRSTVKELADSGIRTVDFESGYSRRLDSQARMNISDGVRQLNANYREVQGEQFGADGVEISAHGLCAVDHQNVQGRQYSNKEFEKLQESLDRPIGSLNCKHSITPIILGVSNPVYSDETLQEYKANSNKQVEYSTLQKDSNGNYIKKTVSKYDFSQVQRKTETDIRRLKDYKNQLDIMGDKIGSIEVQKKITAKTKYYKMISNQGGLSPKTERVRVVK